MRTPRCVWVPDVDKVRVDMPGDGYHTVILLDREQALALAAGLKVALADGEPARARTPRKRP